MATPPTPQPSPPAVVNPRSPWFWTIFGLGILAVGIAAIAVLTRTGVLGRNERVEPPPAVRDGAAVQGRGADSLAATPAERKQALKLRLGQIEDEMKRLQDEQARLRTAVAGRGESAEKGDADVTRTRLAELEALRMSLHEEKVRLEQQLGNP